MRQDVVLPLGELIQIIGSSLTVLVVLGILSGLVAGSLVGLLKSVMNRTSQDFPKTLRSSIFGSVLFSLVAGFCGGLQAYLFVYGFSLPVENPNNTGWGDGRPFTVFIVMPIVFGFLGSLVGGFLGPFVRVRSD